MIWIILAVILAAAAFALHYGYKMAFYYTDPQASPYEYGEDPQVLACKEVLDGAIADFEAAPYEAVFILSREGLKLTGRYYHVAEGAPVQILCHGYKGNAVRDFCGMWQVAKELGHNVLLIDQRAHGKSQGHTITFGILESKDVLGWIEYVNCRFGEVPVILGGVSMGAATVLMASGAGLPENVKAVIADCPFDAPSNIIKKVLEQDMGLPVKLVYPLMKAGGLVYGRFNLESDSPVAAVKRAKRPILLTHGDADHFVPHEMSCNIHAAAPERIEFHTIPGAGHALDFSTEPELFKGIVRDFLKKYL